MCYTSSFTSIPWLKVQPRFCGFSSWIYFADSAGALWITEESRKPRGAYLRRAPRCFRTEEFQTTARVVEYLLNFEGYIFCLLLCTLYTQLHLRVYREIFYRFLYFQNIVKIMNYMTKFVLKIRWRYYEFLVRRSWIQGFKVIIQFSGYTLIFA